MPSLPNVPIPLNDVKPVPVPSDDVKPDDDKSDDDQQLATANDAMVPVKGSSRLQYLQSPRGGRHNPSLHFSIDIVCFRNRIKVRSWNVIGIWLDFASTSLCEPQKVSHRG